MGKLIGYRRTSSYGGGTFGPYARVGVGETSAPEPTPMITCGPDEEGIPPFCYPKGQGGGLPAVGTACPPGQAGIPPVCFVWPQGVEMPSSVGPMVCPPGWSGSFPFCVAPTAGNTSTTPSAVAPPVPEQTAATTETPGAKKMSFQTAAIIGVSAVAVVGLLALVSRRNS